MNKADLINVVYSKNPNIQKKDIEQAINGVIDAIMSCVLSGERVQINGFGSFETMDRMSRVGRNVYSGETVVLPPAKVPVFRPSRAFRKLVDSNG